VSPYLQASPPFKGVVTRLASTVTKVFVTTFSQPVILFPLI
jgi:hypothetical protein